MSRPPSACAKRQDLEMGFDRHCHPTIPRTRSVHRCTVGADIPSRELDSMHMAVAHVYNST